MARTPLYLEVKDTFGNVVPSPVVTVRKRSDNSLATLYQAETGGTTLGNPLAGDSLGRASAYVDRGAYNVAVSGTGITPYTVPFDAAAASDRSLDSLWTLVRPVEAELLTPAQFLALPTQPDGTIVRVQLDAAAGVNAKFRYNAGSASTYKWEYDGGGTRLRALATTNNGWTSPAAFAFQTATGTPSIVVPFAGEWEIQWSYNVTNTAAAVADVRTMSLPVLTPGVNFATVVSIPGANTMTQHRGDGTITTTAGQSVTVQIAASIASSPFSVWDRYIFLLPSRVLGP